MINSSYLSNYCIRRGLAFYIDGLVITVFALIYLFAFDQKGLSIECDNFFCWNTKRVVTFQLVFYSIYFLFLEYFFLNTIGKRLLGFNVSREKNKMFFLGVLMRTLIRLIPLNLISFWFDSDRLFWHEKWTKIFTVKKPAQA